MLTKQGLLYLIAQMPNDIDIFTEINGDYGEIDLKIFLEPKSKEFYEWYFGL